MFLADTHSDTLFSLGVGKRTFAQTDITPDRLRQGGVSLKPSPCGAVERSNGDYEAVADAEYAAIHHFTDAGIRQVDDPEDVKPGENTFMLSFEGCEVFRRATRWWLSGGSAASASARWCGITRTLSPPLPPWTRKRI